MAKEKPIKEERLPGMSISQTKLVAEIIQRGGGEYSTVAALGFMSKENQHKIIDYVAKSLLDSVTESGEQEDFAEELNDFKQSYGLSRMAQKFVTKVAKDKQPK